MSAILAPQSEPRLMMTQHLGGGQLVVTVRGDLDRATVPDFCVFLEGFHPERDLHLNFRHLDFIDVGGVTAVLESARRFEHHGARLHLHEPSPFAIRLFKILGVNHFADIHTDVPQCEYEPQTLSQ